MAIENRVLMTRAIRISLDLATGAKKRRLAAILREFRSAMNFYAKSLWMNSGKLNAVTQNRFKGGSLGYRQWSTALKLALEGIIATRKAAKARGIQCRCPVFRRAVQLSSLVCKVEEGRGSFDYVLKISSLVAREPIVIPFKSHARLNHWLALGGRIIDGAIVCEDRAYIYVQISDAEPKKEGRAVGLDVGFVKLISDSDGKHHGTEMREKCADVRRKKPGSNGKRKAIAARNDYINFVCLRLPWQTTKIFVLEDLTGLKFGKDNRGKRNRKLLSPWSYRQVRTRLEQLAPENRVRLEFVSPTGTSRRCTKCGLEKKENRVGEKFCCLRCHYTADADFVGAQNILAKFATTGNCPESMVPVGVCGKTTIIPDGGKHNYE